AGQVAAWRPHRRWLFALFASRRRHLQDFLAYFRAVFDFVALHPFLSFALGGLLVVLAIWSFMRMSGRNRRRAWLGGADHLRELRHFRFDLNHDFLAKRMRDVLDNPRLDELIKDLLPEMAIDRLQTPERKEQLPKPDDRYANFAFRQSNTTVNWKRAIT